MDEYYYTINESTNLSNYLYYCSTTESYVTTIVYYLTEIVRQQIKYSPCYCTKMDITDPSKSITQLCYCTKTKTDKLSNTPIFLYL